MNLTVQLQLDPKLARAFGPVTFAILVGLFALFVVPVIIGKMTGWSELATRFAFPNPFHGITWRFQSAQMRYAMNYNNCLTVGANAEGLYLKVPFFMAGFAPLFIPWSEISYTEGRVLFRPVIRFRLGREQAIPFTVNERLAERIKEAAGSHWPVRQIE